MNETPLDADISFSAISPENAARPSSVPLTVIVPTYNECRTLDEVARRLKKLPYVMEVLLVDDGSDDGSTEKVMQLASQPGVKALFHENNQGKGACIRTALEVAIGDFIVIQDADLEYDPADIQLLLQPILENVADVVYGSRFLQGSLAECLPMRRAMNRLLTWLSNRFTGLHLTDMETCYKVFRREVFAGMLLRESEFTATIARGKWRIVEIPIAYNGRSHADGKKIGVRDGLRTLYCVVRYRWFD